MVATESALSTSAAFIGLGLDLIYATDPDINLGHLC